jgi:hypothetical protein
VRQKIGFALCKGVLSCNKGFASLLGEPIEKFATRSASTSAEKTVKFVVAFKGLYQVAASWQKSAFTIHQSKRNSEGPIDAMKSEDPWALQVPACVQPLPYSESGMRFCDSRDSNLSRRRLIES